MHAVDQVGARKSSVWNFIWLHLTRSRINFHNLFLVSHAAVNRLLITASIEHSFNLFICLNESKCDWSNADFSSLFSTAVFVFRWKRPKTKQCLDRLMKSRRIVCQVTFIAIEHQKSSQVLLCRNRGQPKQSCSDFFLTTLLRRPSSWSKFSKGTIQTRVSKAILSLEFQHTCCASQLVKSSPQRLQWVDTIQTRNLHSVIKLCFMISNAHAPAVSKQMFCAANVFCVLIARIVMHGVNSYVLVVASHTHWLRR